MMRLLAAALTALTFAAHASAGTPPPVELFAKAATVKVFLYEGQPKSDTGIMLDFHTADPTAVPTAGVTLTAEQVARLKKAFISPKGDDGLGACFVPRHGFVFEDAQGQVIGTLDVCFECTNYSVKAPGYKERVQPVYDRYAQIGQWTEKLQRKQTAEVDAIRATFGMPRTEAPVDWKGLEALVNDLRLPPKPKPDDYERLRKQP